MSIIVVEDEVVGQFSILSQDLSLEVIQVCTCGEQQSTLVTPLYWPSLDEEIDFEDSIDDCE